MHKLFEQLKKSNERSKQLHDEEIKLYKDLISIQKNEIAELQREIIWLLSRRYIWLLSRR